jgi:hypothetical protein
MKIETVVVTPELATKWLSKNTRNRRIDKARVSMYANDMLADRWKLNGETIKFNGDVLLDGQHRLLACMKASRPFVSAVASGVDGDVFDTVDRGKTRSPADIFYLSGEKNSVLLGSTLSFMHKYLVGLPFEGSGGDKSPTMGRLEELLAEYPETRECVSFVSGLSWLKKVLRGSMAAGVATLTYGVNPELTRAFWRDVNDGTDTFQPASKLRQKLIDNAIAKTKLRANDLGAMVIRCWNAVIDGEEIKVLRCMRTEGDKPEQRPILKVNRTTYLRWD